MTRLRERQNEIEPSRISFAIKELQDKGFEVKQISERELQIEYKNSIIKIFPYTGWFTGKTINDGRGIKNLLKQLK